MIMACQGLQFWVAQNSNSFISDVIIAKQEEKFYHCDVIMAKFENLASQICCSAQWESNLGDLLQKSVLLL